MFKYFKRILNKVLPAGVKYTFKIEWFINKQNYYKKLKNRIKRQKHIKLREIQMLFKQEKTLILYKNLLKPSNKLLNNKIRVLMKCLNFRANYKK